MAVINDPTTAANIARVGMASGMVWTPQHQTAGPLPVGAGGAYRLAMQTGTIAASLAKDSEVFQFRYVTAASRVCIVHGIAVSAIMITPPAVGVVGIPMGLYGNVARAWTAAGSGGSRATMTGNNQKLRTAHATSEVNDIGIATTAALTAGTKTFDAQGFGSVLGSIYFDLAAGDVGGQLIPKTNLLGEFIGGMAFPMVLANQEGFAIRSALAMPATMTWQVSVDVLWSEVDGF